MKIHFCLFVISAILLFNSRSNAQSNNAFIIKGVIDTIPFAQYFLTYKSNGEQIRDTIILNKDREFEYSGDLTEPTILRLEIPNTFNSRSVGDQTVYAFWVEPKKNMYFEGKKGWLISGKFGLVTDPSKYELKNSEIDNLAIKYRKSYRDAYAVWEKATGQPISDEARKHIYDSVFNDFMRQGSLSYYKLYLLSNKLLTKPPGYNLVENWLLQFSDSLKNTYLAKDMIRRITIHQQLSIGKVLPDFEQTDTSLNPIKLSSYKGQYVLVDFWASWCTPCRKEHPYLKQAYQRFRDSGFEILGISLDDTREDWLKAIHDDGLMWTQLSDLKGFDNDVAKQFFIHAIPDSFLIDPNGVIIAKGLRGKELEEKLEELLEDYN